MLRMDQQLGKPVLIEFWDFCRANSIRTLPYMEAWHERYKDDGLRVIGVHTSGFAPSENAEAVKAAVKRLKITYPVVVDVEREIWALYGNLGWPARYLIDQRGCLAYYHYGEGAYEETELAIQELLGIERATVPPLKPEDAPGATLAPQTEDKEGAYSGPYQAGGVWAVLEGRGTVAANGHMLTIDGPGCYELISHPRSTAGTVRLELGNGVRCLATCFTPGLAS